MKELKNGEWVEAEPIKYERFALINDMLTSIKGRLKEIISELKGE